jgi:hypothetical protein
MTYAADHLFDSARVGATHTIDARKITTPLRGSLGPTETTTFAQAWNADRGVLRRAQLAKARSSGEDGGVAYVHLADCGAWRKSQADRADCRRSGSVALGF